jgi:hypothetical protein
MMINVDWRQPFIDYLREQKVPSDKNLVKQLIRRAKSYVLVGDKLYRRGASTKASTATTHPLEHWSARPSDELSIGPQLWAMPKNSLEGARNANISPSNNTSRPTS